MDIVRNGVLLVVYLFVIVVLFIVISGVFEDIVVGVEDVNATASDARVEVHGGYIRTVFNMIFALFALVPIIWFIAWAFHREPDWRFRQ